MVGLLAALQTPLPVRHVAEENKTVDLKVVLA
jgi:hypothetical protein